MSRISFASASYVARAVGYYMIEGWEQGDRATQNYFRPIETFASRFSQILHDVRALGFAAIDIWAAHLHWSWATDAHIAIARDLLRQHNLRVTSLAGDFGSNEQEFEAACRLAVALNTPLLGGTAAALTTERATVVAALKRHGLKLAIENDAEKNPDEVLARIGDGGGGTLGTTVDTGAYGAQGYDAARAIAQLGHHVMHIHLKDVLKADDYQTCRYGHGVVPLESCVRTLKHIGYDGSITVEHEPALFDPTDDVKASVALLRQWLRSNT